MLILSRRVMEHVNLTDERTGKLIGRVHVMGIRGGQVKLGFDDMPHIKVMRSELEEGEEEPERRP